MWSAGGLDRTVGGEAEVRPAVDVFLVVEPLSSTAAAR